MEIQNGLIRSVQIHIEDHGILTAWLHIEHGWGNQGFGGYGLYYPDKPDNMGKFVWRCLETLRVHDWKDLIGSPLRIKIDDGLIRSIGHIIEDRWFTPSEELR